MKSRLVSLFPQQDWSQINCKLYRRRQKAQKSIDDRIQESKPIFHSSQLGLGLPQSKNDGEGVGSYNLRGETLVHLTTNHGGRAAWGRGEKRALSGLEREAGSQNSLLPPAAFTIWKIFTLGINPITVHHLFLFLGLLVLCFCSLAY